MKAIIYLRTSTEEQNPENQLEDCLTLIKPEWETEEPIQEQQSAFKDNEREKFEAIKKRISRGEVQHLIVWDWDRLFRNRKKLKEFFEFCRIYKCEIHSFRQNWFEDLYQIPEPFNEIIQEVVLNLMGWLAEDESRKKSERVKKSVRKEEGITKSYKGNKWGRKQVVSEKLFEKIKELKQQGLSIRQIQSNPEVYYYDKNRNKARVSIATIHGILKE